MRPSRQDAIAYVSEIGGDSGAKLLEKYCLGVQLTWRQPQRSIRIHSLGYLLR